MQKSQRKLSATLFYKTPVFSFLMSSRFAPSFSLTVSDYSCKSPQLPSRQAFSMKAGEALRGRREGAGEASTEEPCTSENLEELGLKAMEIVGGYKKGKKERKEEKKLRGSVCIIIKMRGDVMKNRF